VKQERLGELPLAQLTKEQLEQLRQTEENMSREGKPVFLIAFEKESPSQ
jgi:hypothetical protein